MEISQGQLALIYVFAGVFGMILGLFYDGMRVLRIFFGEHFSPLANRFQNVDLPLIGKSDLPRKKNRILAAVVFAEDFLFCVSAGIGMILLFYQLNHGKIRLLAFPIAVAGFYLYRWTLGKLVMAASETVAFIFGAAVRYLFFFLLFPWKWMIQATLRYCKSRIRMMRQKRHREQRFHYTEKQNQDLERLVKDQLFEQKEGGTHDVGKKKEAIQSEPVGKNFFGSHRSGISGSVH